MINLDLVSRRHLTLPPTYHILTQLYESDGQQGGKGIETTQMIGTCI